MKVTQAQYARMRGVSKQYIGQLVAQGFLVLGPHGLLDVDAADQSLDANRPHPLRIEADA